MEIWFNTDTRKIRLPVLPPELFINGGVIETSIDMLGSGEVSLFGGNKLDNCEFSSFFPALKNRDSYPFLQFKDYYDPYYYVKQFNWWKKYDQVVQFIATPNVASIPVKIVKFEYGENDGTGDVYFTLKWKEVKPIKVRKLSTSTNNSTNNGTNNSASDNTQRPPSQTQEKEESNKQKTHTVVKGDTLWGLAQKHYGKGSDYPKIQNANISKYPSLKNNPSYILVGWVLVIP